MSILDALRGLWPARAPVKWLDEHSYGTTFVRTHDAQCMAVYDPINYDCLPECETDGQLRVRIRGSL